MTHLHIKATKIIFVENRKETNCIGCSNYLYGFKFKPHPYGKDKIQKRLMLSNVSQKSLALFFLILLLNVSVHIVVGFLYFVLLKVLNTISLQYFGVLLLLRAKYLYVPRFYIVYMFICLFWIILFMCVVLSLSPLPLFLKKPSCLATY